ncbi:hypothetical protein [Methylobacterium planeticum]|uniref:Secreted protein n=1 Tax=Methylobacterium planeticum TaxID=2615211 RepID=A0A6N6MU39_9HYPH|nr:hypothetical protein [Methylobacterium planeticum]KAB1074619.1 hypothetical protein F6X51_05660 [Methylobacterium planeticum]
MPRMIPVTFLVISLALHAGSTASFAQTAVTGTGGGPETTITAPNTSSVGRTMPTGTADAPLLDPRERTSRQRNLDAVLNGVCAGC